MKKALNAVVLIGIFLRISAAQPPVLAQLPPDAQIRGVLMDRIERARLGVGMVVGVVEPRGNRIIAYGRLDAGDKRTLDGDTVFEIGSVTQVFTSLLLADMARRGEVALKDPVEKYLPQSVKVPSRAGRRITLEDLATHTSGLPRLPANLKTANPANPYAEYSPELLYEFLSTYKLWRDVGTGFEYSNVGAGLLGQALARRAGMSYEALVRTRITEPLGMGSTGVTLSPQMKAHRAVGHNATLTAVPDWDFQALAPSAGLRSTANDQVAFLAACLGGTASPLAPAMAAMLKTRRPTVLPGMEMALGWAVTDTGIVWANGSTGGYRAFLGFQPKSHVGVVVLANTFTDAGLNDIGMHLLSSR